MRDCPRDKRTSLPKVRVTLTLLIAGAATGSLLAAASLHSQAPQPQAPPEELSVPEWQAAAGGRMSFNAASVKRNISGPDAPVHWNVPPSSDDNFSPTGGLLSLTNLGAINLIRFAYKVTPSEQIVTDVLPRWTKTTRYDIEARAAGNPTKDQYRLMTQTLLADRFKLAAHWETRASPVLALELIKSGKLGPNLRRYSENPTEPCVTGNPSPSTPQPMVADGLPAQCGSLVVTLGSTSGAIRFSARAVTAASMAEMLGSEHPGASGKPVVDRTGLPKVSFFIELPMRRPDDDDASRSALFVEALKEQLGLKFRATRGDVNLLIVDHIEWPSPN